MLAATMTSDLKTLQKRFQDYLIGESEDFVQDIVSTADAFAEHRLGAYYNAYRIRLINCLATDFPALQKSLGEEAFEYLVLDYLRLYPSEHPSVRWLGRKMSEFLQHSSYDNREFLAELAAFEWAQGLCFDAAERDRLVQLEDMAGISAEDWPTMTFEFHPSMRWLDLHWNVPPYWSAQDNAQDLPQPTHDPTPTRWLMWRKQTSPNWRSLTVDEAWAIEAARSGASFADLCEGMLEWMGPDAVAMQAAGYLKQWISDEIIVAIHQPG
jgi:hypothetical protein